jgi:tetratricopeptide (TPR) repeat protein
MNRLWLSMIISLILLTAVAVPTVDAQEPYVGYNYSYWGNTVPSPIAYSADRAISGDQLGIGGFNRPQDVFVANNHVYILDSGNGRIVMLNDKLEFVRQIEGFVRGGKQETFNNPQGLFVTGAGNLFVADTDNQRLIELDESGDFVREITAPSSDVLSDGFQFYPSKVALDKAKRIYVAGRGVFDGIIQLDADGEFQTFMGTNRVRYNVIDYFWKTISTRAQRAQMEQFVPVEYNNFDIDDAGFIYATSAVRGSDMPVKRLNPSGTDVLRQQGYFKPIGDIKPPQLGSIVGFSNFVDVAVGDNGIYSVLDNKRGRIFTYDEDSNLIYVFGLIGNQEGTFRSAAAIARLDERIVVLDNTTNQLTVFSPTAFGSLINEAARYHYMGDEERSAELWEQVAQLDANYEIAYIGIGKALLRQGRNKEAAEYFKLGFSRDYYSKAYQRHREEILERHFGAIMLGLLVVSAAVIAFAVIRKRKWKNRPSNYVKERGPIAFVFHILFHPFDGYWDLKYENKARISIALILVLLLVVVNAMRDQFAGFVVNYNNPLYLNSLDQLLFVLLPFFLWCVANWSLTTLMGGEGKFKEIVIGTAYSLTPMILIYIPTTIWSNFMTVEESAFYYLLNSIAVGWFLYLFFVSTMTVHQYSVTKTVVTIILTILAMAFIVFLAMLFFSLVQQVAAFLSTVYSEFAYRL